MNPFFHCHSQPAKGHSFHKRSIRSGQDWRKLSRSVALMAFLAMVLVMGFSAPVSAAGQSDKIARIRAIFEKILQKLGTAVDEELTIFISRKKPLQKAPAHAQVQSKSQAKSQAAPVDPPTTEENGEQAWINTIQNPNIAPKSSYRNAVNGAIDQIIAAGTGLEAPGSNHIVNYDAYHAAVVAELQKQGFKALHDGEELAICRAGDTFSEQFDISTASGLVRRFYAAYIRPAVQGLRAGNPSSPLPPAKPGTPSPKSQPSPQGNPGEFVQPSPLIPDVPGQTAYCNTIQKPNIAPPSKHRGAVNKAIDLVIAAGTGLKAPGSTEFADVDLYHKAVVSELRKMGYCAAHDGEELAIKLPGQNFNEQFDISTASGLVRRFYAAWLTPPSVGE